MAFLYFDTEYRNNQKAGEILLLSYMASTEKITKCIDLRDQRASQVVNEFVNKHRDHVWVAFNAQADLTALQTLGVDISSLTIVDVLIEANMVSLTHSDYFCHKHDLITVCRTFGIEPPCARHFKDEMRRLILENEVYHAKQWSRIRVYGAMDIEPLPKLLSRVWDIHEARNTQVALSEMVQRGEYIKAVTLLANASRGFEVDRELLYGIFANKVGFIRHLQANVNKEYGPLYVDHKPDEEMVWNHKAFTRFVQRAGYEWHTTVTNGQMVTSAEYFKEKSRQYPELLTLYHTRKSIDAMRSKDLRTLEENGYIKPVSVPFSQKTGRNSPKPSLGFLLNLPPWMRSLIKPSEGNVLIGVDWEQQEVAIAAVLSGDAKYMQAYNADDGDVYLKLAKMAGAVPTDATKTSHPIERQTFKAVQLGLGYGKGLRSLATDVRAANRSHDGRYLLTRTEALDKADAILTWHKRTFFEYWDWVSDNVTRARIDGYLKSLDGWVYFVDDKVRDTQLLNFPMQANGAAMMRYAVRNAAELRTFDLVCTLHDALYANSSQEDKDAVISEIVKCMDDACEQLLGDTLRIRTDISVYDSRTGYKDPRGEDMLKQVTAFIKKNPHL